MASASTSGGERGLGAAAPVPPEGGAAVPDAAILTPDAAPGAASDASPEAPAPGATGAPPAAEPGDLPTDRRRRRGPVPAIVWAGLLVLGLLAAIGGIFRYSADVRTEIDHLAIANSDNLQWSLAQLEVEFDRLRITLLESAPTAEAPTPAALSEIAQRFDIFYARVQTVLEGQRFRAVVSNVEVNRSVETLQAFVARTAATVDRGPAALAAALPELRAETAGLAEDVRRVSLQGLREFAEQAKVQRERVFNALVRLAALTTALLGVLTAGLIAMWWLWRFGMRQARSLRAAKARLEAVISTALDAVIVIDQEGRVTEFNPAAERIFGYRRDEAMGRRLGALIVPGSQIAAHERGFRRYLETGEARIVGRGLVSLEARRRDGSKFPVELSVSTTRIERRQVFVSYLRDITARVSAERELIEARDRAMQGERAKAAFVAVMSHEMRTPLNGLLGTLELLRETPLDAEQDRFVQAMEQAGQILLQHVNDVLDVERLDAGKLSFSRRAFDPITLVTQLIEAQRDAAAARGNRMEMQSLGPLPAAIEGDPIRIRQVLLNLIGNAVKFTNEGLVRVEIEYHPGPSEIEFRVIDTGVGIAPEDAARIFDDFVTLDPAQSREHTGSGLGLGIARRIVQAMGGRIGVESEPGEGSVFWLTLPAPARDRPAETPASAAAPARPRAPHRPLDVLVVEDNKINRTVMCEMLRRAGHHPSEAQNGREGVERAAGHAFDLILMDMNMPELNGIEATMAIRGQPGPSRATPIFAVTANVLPEARAQLQAAGVTRVLAKPITRTGLEAALAELGPAAARSTPDRVPAQAGVAAPVAADGAVPPGQDASRPDAPAQAEHGAPRNPAPASSPSDSPPSDSLPADSSGGPSRAPDETGAKAGPTPPAAPSAEPMAPVFADEILDHSVLDDLIDALGPDGFAETRALFEADGAVQIAAIIEAAAAGDHLALGRAAHRLAGAAALMGAAPLRALLGELEQDARRAEAARIGAALPDLAPLWRDSLAALARIGPPPGAVPPRRARPPAPPPRRVVQD